MRGFRTDWTVPRRADPPAGGYQAGIRDSDADIWVMAPMISTTSEARNFAKMLKEVGLPVHGVMVETPAAAVNAEAILGEVDSCRSVPTI